MDKEAIKSRIYSLASIMVAKITSARFLATIAVIGTLCWSVGKCLDMVIKCSADEKTFTLIKDIIMFILGAFVTTVTAVVTSYFHRTDRNGKEDTNGQTLNK